MELDVTKEKAINVRGIPEELWQRVRVEAVKNRMSIQEYVVLIFREHFAGQRKSA